MLKVLINRFNAKAGNALLRFLPQDEAKAVNEQNITSTDLTPLLFKPKMFLERIHASWLKPVIQELPESMRPFVLAVLTPDQLADLKSSIKPARLPEPLKGFFVKQLFDAFKDTDHLPIEYLPEAELSVLLSWPKAKLTTLVSFLGLHDLATEVRHIVNKTYLKNIYSCLTPKQFYYLKVCLHQKEVLTAPKLPLDPTKQDCQRLKLILQQRGIIRLGNAFSGEHADFTWHLAHILDNARGAALMNAYRPESIPQITAFLKSQVANLITYLKEE